MSEKGTFLQNGLMRVGSKNIQRGDFEKLEDLKYIEF